MHRFVAHDEPLRLITLIDDDWPDTMMGKMRIREALELCQRKCGGRARRVSVHRTSSKSMACMMVDDVCRELGWYIRVYEPEWGKYEQARDAFTARDEFMVTEAKPTALVVFGNGRFTMRARKMVLDWHDEHAKTNKKGKSLPKLNPGVKGDDSTAKFYCPCPVRRPKKSEAPKQAYVAPWLPTADTQIDLSNSAVETNMSSDHHSEALWSSHIGETSLVNSSCMTLDFAVSASRSKKKSRAGAGDDDLGPPMECTAVSSSFSFPGPLPSYKRPRDSDEDDTSEATAAHPPKVHR